MNLFTFICQLIAHWRVCSQPTVNWMCVLSVYLDFLKYWKLHIVIFIHKLSNLLFCPWLLTWKLIAWKGKNLKPLVLEVLSNLIQLFVIWVSVRALTGNIYKKKGFTVLELRKQDPISFNILAFDVINSGWRGLYGLALRFIFVTHFK